MNDENDLKFQRWVGDPALRKNTSDGTFKPMRDMTPGRKIKDKYRELIYRLRFGLCEEKNEKNPLP